MRRILAIPVLVCWLLLVSACSDHSGTGIASANGDTQPTASHNPADDVNAEAQFAKCMRDHGQNVPDPDPDTGMFHVTPPSGDGQHEAGSAWDTAVQACQHFLPAGGQLTQHGATPAELEQLRAFAACMRAHDIDISDPETTGDRIGNMIIRGRLEFLTRAQVEADPGFRAAMDACKDKLPDGNPGKDGGVK